MITAISFHAIERLQERRKLDHLLRHINKIRKWNLPPNGLTIHKGYGYVTKNGILITILPKEMRNKAIYKEKK